MRSVFDHSAHTAFSDPGRHAGLLAQLPTDPAPLSEVARNVIVHYRASGHVLPVDTRNDINARRLENILDADQSQHRQSLQEPRELTGRVQGCCRDHTLFCFGALRARWIAARSRVGFAGYFVDGWHHDHVIVEAWLDDRWVRFDSELDRPRALLPARVRRDCSMLWRAASYPWPLAWIFVVTTTSDDGTPLRRIDPPTSASLR